LKPYPPSAENHRTDRRGP